VPPVPTNSGSSGRYTVVAIILHWMMALGILALAAIGVVMVHLNIPLQRKFELYQLHKSIGVTILLAALLRMGWRLTLVCLAADWMGTRLGIGPRHSDRPVWGHP
jgi:cytochrome b561